MSPVTLGQHIVAARRARGWTQYDLAAEVGVRRCTISRWERGVQRQHPAHRTALAETLGITPPQVAGRRAS